MTRLIIWYETLPYLQRLALRTATLFALASLIAFAHTIVTSL